MTGVQTCALPISQTTALTAFSAAPTVVAVLSSNGLSAISGISSSSFIAAITAHSMNVSAVTVGTAGPTVVSVMESGGLIAGFQITATSFVGAITAVSMNASAVTIGTAAPTVVSVMESGGLIGISGIAGTSSIAALTAAGFAALSTMTLGNASEPSFIFIGTGSTTQPFPDAINYGIGSTGAIPVSIGALNTTTTNGPIITWTGSIVLNQPWFQLLGV